MGTYVAVVYLVFPVFMREMMPLLVDAYLPVKVPLWRVGLTAAVSVVFPAFMVLLVDRARIRETATAILLLAASGFALAVVIQGKSFPNHFYPVFALAAFALASALIERLIQRPAGTWAMAGLAIGFFGLSLVGGAGLQLFALRPESAELIETVRRLAPPHPKIAALTADLSIGHPLTRMVGGQWLGKYCAHWITGNVEGLLRADVDETTRRRLEADLRLDRDALVEELSAGQPDVVLIDGDTWRKWAQDHADVGLALVPYHEAARVEGTSVLVRRAP